MGKRSDSIPLGLRGPTRARVIASTADGSDSHGRPMVSHYYNYTAGLEALSHDAEPCPVGHGDGRDFIGTRPFDLERVAPLAGDQEKIAARSAHLSYYSITVFHLVSDLKATHGTWICVCTFS